MRFAYPPYALAAMFGGREDAAAARARIAAEDRRGLGILRDNCRAEVGERIANSLFRQLRIALGRRSEPGAVAAPWARELECPERPAEPLPAERPTVEVFDTSAGRLLILGEPGAGKTVELLHLARDLLARDGADDPVPVVLNLSSWDDAGLTLADWLVRELRRRYRIPERDGARWVAEERLLPLLDGLDEVAAPLRHACAAAIDAFRQDHHRTRLAVCCRGADYGALPPLGLNAALRLLPLDRGQIERYLADAGPPLAGLRQALREAPALAALAETPLMLNVMSLTYRGRPGAEIAAAATGPAALFDAYLDRALSRKVGGPAALAPEGRALPDSPWTQAQTRRWLGRLANELQRRGRTFFQIEDLQLDWANRWVWLGAWSALCALLFVVGGFWGGGLAGLAGWLLAGRDPGLVDGLVRSGEAGLFVGAVFGLWAILVGRQIEPKERLFWRWAELRETGLRPVLAVAVLLATAMATLGLLRDGPGSVIPYAIIGLIIAAILGLFWAGLGSRVETRRARPGQGIRTSLSNGLRFGIVGLPLIFAIFWVAALVLPDDLPYGTWPGWQGLPRLAVVGFAMGFLLTGGFEVIAHAALRLALALQRRLPLRLIGFLDHATRLILLRRVGGGWTFIHRMLQEHLAAAYRADAERPGTDG